MGKLVGEYGQARDYYTRSLALARRLGYRFSEAEALRGLGEVEWLIGGSADRRMWPGRRVLHPAALDLARQLGYRFGEL